MIVTFGIGLLVLFSLNALAVNLGYWFAALVSGLVLMIAGAVACIITIAAKWLIVGRIGREEHPLWSSFVWRNEVSDTFVEMVAAPWFGQATPGTAVMNLWLRGLGAKIGRGVWCESYWLPEATSSLWVPARPWRGGAWFRPTCSMIGSCPWTP